MQPDTAERLVTLNKHFYTDFGESFSATRGRVQPGVRRVLATLQQTEAILDLGCGNGSVARVLAESGHRGSYLGLDFSPPLLAAAIAGVAGFHASFRQADLTATDWEQGITGHPEGQSASFERVFAFAFLHHIPGHDRRLNILQQARCLLAPGGSFIHSEWQFLNSEKLKARIQPWEKAGLRPGDVDEGDALLDWRAGGNGLRYVHQFSEPELAGLAAEGGFKVVDSFLSDGQGGRLSLYQTWEGL